MVKPKKAPPESADLTGMAARLQRESDRGCALIVASWVDDALTDFLKAYLVQDAKIIDDLFRPMGPLGSFSAKISMAYLRGLIDRTMFDNLNTIREVRNDFAHSRADISF